MNLIGRTLGRYQVLDRLGEGAMGAVYKARDRDLGRLVALKILPSFHSEDAAARFEREARAISALNHPHIATIYALDQADGLRFLALEYVPGGTLTDKLEQTRAEGRLLSPKEALEATLEIAEGLAHAHRKNVVHRDIKSDNILVAEDGSLKVADFGVAKFELESSFTEEGSVLGTMAYMAPEQILGEPTDYRADLFSFGVLAYEIACGERPFQSPHPSALQYDILNGDPAPFAETRQDLPERFEELVLRCLEKRPEDRPASMEAVCETCAELHRELTASSNSGASGDLDRPLRTRPLEIGETVGRYKLLSKIGEGGMGSVYRALDLNLDRQVALKTLKAEAVSKPERRLRFIQEARAASALHHPHIVTVHEIDERDGVHFIAMEYVAGATLAQRCQAGACSPREALQLAIQIAGALAAAHAAGIVHRDLKPANVMVDEKDQAKLLDFGLAKLTELGWSGSGSQPPQSSNAPETEDGQILGTIAYMSPEQAEGRSVDSRSDVFSFGALLYETLSGRRAFGSDSKAGTLAAILNRQPTPLREIAPGVPPALEAIVHRCLRKAPDKRFQHFGDIKIALEELLEDLEAGRLEPQTAAAAPMVRSAWRDLAVGAVAGALLMGLAMWALQSRAAEDAPSTANVGVTLSQLTGAAGLAMHPTWSPDGAWIAYASDRAGSMDLWKKPADGGEDIRLTATPEAEIEPAWSPDGRNLAFVIESELGGIYLMPSDGGQAVRVSGFGAHPAWSPDGRQIAFDWNGAIYTVNYAGGEPVEIASGTSGTPYIEWSPDGRHIYYWDRTHRDIFRVDVESRATQQLHLIPTGEEVAGLTYSSAGSTLVFSKGSFGGDKDLWQVKMGPDAMPSGSATRLTVSATDDVQCRFSADGSRLAFTAQHIDRQLWGLSLDPKTGLAGGDARLITVRGQRNYYPAASRDGAMLAWTSQNAGQGVIYYLREGDEEPHKLTREWDRHTREVGPAIAPDGIQIAYASTAGGAYQLWRMPAPDSVALQLSSVERPFSDSQPAWSPDGKVITFYSNRLGNWDIWALDPAAGDEPKQLLDWPSNELYPAFSPDGSELAFLSTRDDNADIWRLNLATGETSPLVQHPAVEGHGAWSPDGRRFYFSSNRGGSFAIWMMPAEGGEAQRVTPSSMTLPDTALYTKFAVTDSELIVPLENRRGDVYVLENLD